MAEDFAELTVVNPYGNEYHDPGYDSGYDSLDELKYDYPQDDYDVLYVPVPGPKGDEGPRGKKGDKGDKGK